MGLSYQFLWNEQVLVIEFIGGDDESGQRTVEYQLRLPRDEAIKFAQTMNLYASTRLKKGDSKQVDVPTPLPQ